jgi:L-lactate dehydrogenase
METEGDAAMRIGIVGTGLVGSTAGYALVMRGIGSELVLVDVNAARAAAEADDIAHAVPFAHSIRVEAGEFADLGDCRVVVLACGVNQRPGETRLELLGRNAAIFRDVVPRVVAAAPGAVLLVATNPVDLMTHLTARFAGAAGVPRERVLGSGTTLDTARFRALLAARLGVDAHHVHAYVVGEHGDSEVLCWSLATVGVTPLVDFCRQQGIEIGTEDRMEIDRQVRRAAYTIISGKGATYYGIGSALARIVEAILHDQRAILTVCGPLDEAGGIPNVTLSLPRLVGGGGLRGVLNLPLDESERQALAASARVIAEALGGIEASE